MAKGQLRVRDQMLEKHSLLESRDRWPSPIQQLSTLCQSALNAGVSMSATADTSKTSIYVDGLWSTILRAVIPSYDAYCWFGAASHNPALITQHLFQ